MNRAECAHITFVYMNCNKGSLQKYKCVSKFRMKWPFVPVNPIAKTDDGKHSSL